MPALCTHLCPCTLPRARTQPWCPSSCSPFAHAVAQEHTDACLLSFLLCICPCGVISVFPENGFGQAGKRPEPGGWQEPGWPDLSRGPAPAEMVNTVKLLLILLASRPASSGTGGVLPCGWLPHLKLRPPQAWCCALGCGTFPQGGSPARHLGITGSSVGGRWGNGRTSLGVAAESCRPPESQLGTWRSPRPARCVPCHSLPPTPESQVGWMEGSVAGRGL